MTLPATLAQNSKQLLLNSFRAFYQDSDELDLEQIRFTDRIFYHEDFYDLGAMIYQHVPVLGRIIRFINQRIGR